MNYEGMVLPFKIRNKMMPFKVVRQDGSHLTIQSLDLNYEMKICSDTWNKQMHILYLCKKMDEFDESALEESRACRD